MLGVVAIVTRVVRVTGASAIVAFAIVGACVLDRSGSAPEGESPTTTQGATAANTGQGGAVIASTAASGGAGPGGGGGAPSAGGGGSGGTGGMMCALGCMGCMDGECCTEACSGTDCHCDHSCDMCDFDCMQPTCAAKCSGDSVCTIDCAGLSDCSPICESGADCTVNCTSSTCVVGCKGGSHCLVNCTASTCVVTCENNNTTCECLGAGCTCMEMSGGNCLP
jgi:hypothetical protein